MTRKWYGGIAGLLVCAALSYAEEPSKEYLAILKEYQQEGTAFTKAILEKTAEITQSDSGVSQSKLIAVARAELVTLQPSARVYAARFLDLAKKYPDDPVALRSLTWIVGSAYFGTEVAEALAILTRDYAKHPRIYSACRPLSLSYSQGAETLLRAVIINHPDEKVRGKTCLVLAKYHLAQSGLPAEFKTLTGTRLKERAHLHGVDVKGYFITPEADKRAAAHAAKAEKAFARVVDEFGEIKLGRKSLKEFAETELYVLKYLAVGKPAPEIAGEDTDGIEFKLSDYRGKVVLLDFWGHW